MKVSLVFLTWNRLHFLKRALPHNIRTAGYPIDEIIWCDNGSTDGTKEWLETYLSGFNYKAILNEENKGVAEGYNSCYRLCKGEIIARPSSYKCMPENWLKEMVKYHEQVEGTGIVGMISQSFEHVLETRYTGRIVFRNGFKIQPANVLGCISFKRSILDKGIYLPNLNNKYGYEDTIWTQKVQEEGYLNYYIPGIVEDFPKEEMQMYPEYVKWKEKECQKFEKEQPELSAFLRTKING